MDAIRRGQIPSSRGMIRVGYDADTAKYYYRDREGVLYAGASGAEHGELVRVPEAVQDGDMEAAPARPDGYQPLEVDQPNHHTGNKNAYRSLGPFLLIIAVALLLVWRLIISPAMAPPKSECGAVMMAYWPPGDSCWEIAREHERGLWLTVNLFVQP